MSKEYGAYLQFLAAEYNVLYIGKASEDVYDETSEYFMSASKIDINQEMLEKITSVLTKRHIDVVVIDVQNNNPLAVKFYHAIRNFNEDILIMLMFDPREYRKLFEIVPDVDATVSYPINRETFHKRFFILLSCPYALKSIGRRDIVLKQESVTEDSIEKFFDTYEGSALFLSDDLMEIVKNLNDGNISYQFLLNIATKLDEVANIFSNAKEMRGVTTIYEGLADYLRKLSLDDIEAKNLEGFTYLAEILSDASVYLMDMFVDRIFKDVYVFEHSLQNNIDFMKNRLDGNKDDVSELEFF